VLKPSAASCLWSSWLKAIDDHSFRDGAFEVAIHVKGVAPKVKIGVGLHDKSIKVEARGALTLYLGRVALATWS